MKRKQFVEDVLENAAGSRREAIMDVEYPDELVCGDFTTSDIDRIFGKNVYRKTRS